MSDNDIVRKWGGPVAPAQDWQELADRQAVCELAKIYAIGMDMRDYELARSAFADECMIDGRGGVSEPVDISLKNTYKLASSFHTTQHTIANQYVTLNGDEAIVWSYGVAHHKVAPNEDRDEIIAGVHYRDTCKRFAEGWLIVHRKVAPQWVDMARPRRN